MEDMFVTTLVTMTYYGFKWLISANESFVKICFNLKKSLILA